MVIGVKDLRERQRVVRLTPVKIPTIAEAAREPSSWPCWPRLPIKNPREPLPDGFPRLAVLVDVGATDGPGDVRYLDGSLEVTVEQLSSAPKADCAALQAAGWVVD